MRRKAVYGPTPGLLLLALIVRQHEELGKSRDDARVCPRQTLRGRKKGKGLVALRPRRRPSRNRPSRARRAATGREGL